MADSRPWSNEEKNELLAEIIKTASPHPSVLFTVLANLNFQPRWDDTPLPRGRSPKQCRTVFEHLRQTLPTHPMMAGPLIPQTPLSAPPAGLKRPFQLEVPYPAGREIRPKPFPSAGAAAQPTTTEPGPKRKRGRPTKAQAQAKAEAEAQARAGGPAPAGPAPPLPQVSPQTAVFAGSGAPAPIPGTVEEPKPALAPTTRMPISAVLTPTAPKTASNSSSSSGKRRRGRSTRSEPEGLGHGEFAGPVQFPYESPYARAAEMPEDSPARTAVMRHREEPGVYQQQQQYTSMPEPRPGIG